MIDVAIVVDEYKNEIYFGKSVSECRDYCYNHDITGDNGEYIAIGVFNKENGYFEIEDYAEIEDGLNW